MLVAGAALTLLLIVQAAHTRAQSGPDLTAEITLDPALPEVGEEVTVSVRIKNQGDVGVPSGASFVTYLYVDPVDRPPEPDTPDEYYWPWTTGLPAGGSHQWSGRTYTFTAGCDHVIYVWVDRDGQIAEINEQNNLVVKTVCAGVTCDADAYEDDDSCADANWAGPGAAQAHTLCPVGDQDWIKFTVIGGLTYTIEAVDLEAHAEPILYLYQTCDGLYQFGTGPSIEWYAPASGVAYVQVEHALPDHGPLAGYDLSITPSGGSGDIYEPDNSCGTARDISTNGAPQTHVFQAAGDQDWVRFSVESGDALGIVADNVAPGANPLISLFSSCGQAFGDLTDQEGELSATAPTAQTYYARVTNQDPDTFGPDVHYNLSVSRLSCSPDGYEDDDGAAAAREYLTSGGSETHDICPSGDEDWVSFTAQAGTIYVLQTSELGTAADTVLTLYDTDGTTALATNDDYGYTAASRIVWQAPADGTYFAMVKHHNPGAAGPNTNYDLSIREGVCIPDPFEGDNSRLQAAPLVSDGQAQTRSFCADPLSTDVADQDWFRFDAVAGSPYVIRTGNLGPQADTVVDLYGAAGNALASNDDYGIGGDSSISITLSTAGTYYVRVTGYNGRVLGDGTDYDLSVTGDIPPTPTPTPTPPPMPTPTPPPTPAPGDVRTVILVNRERVESLYSASEANDLMSKLYELADHDDVQGLVVQVETDTSVGAAYAAWTASPAALLDPAQANAVASAVRNLVMSFLGSHANVEYIVIVGGDPVIPFRRVPEGTLSKTEASYAASVTISTTQWSACENDRLLTDDYYVDALPSDWEGGELYIPDYAVGRLIEEPSEIVAFIDGFLADPVTEIGDALVTGYDFVQDAASSMSTLFDYDGITVDDSLVGNMWPGSSFSDKQLAADPPYPIQSINGHASHLAQGAPDDDPVTASEIATATSDLSGALIFSVGCHAGLNDTGALDLAQAFAQQGANYVANTGYGWGGSAVVYSEALMKTFTRELLRGTSARIGPSLTAAKHRYVQQARSIGPYDVKILMQSTLYGLPMVEVTTGGTLAPEDPFPSANITPTAPSAFGGVNVGHLSYELAGSFGMSTTPNVSGTFVTLDGWSHFAAGEPMQPLFFADAAAPGAGNLHGVVLLGGSYSDTPAFDPVIALPLNEYITSTAEPSFEADGWYPPVPFHVDASGSISTSAQTMVTVLGQYDSASGAERLYDDMSFATYYSSSPDTEPPIISRVDGVLDENGVTAAIKTAASDPSGIVRVVLAHTDGQGTWQSQDLTYQDGMGKWTGTISATTETRFFVQVVDGAGNVALDDAKGRYHSLAPPLPLAQSSLEAIYLPLVLKGG